MPIVIVCPKCASHYRLDDRYAGRRVTCRSCGYTMTAPELPQEGNPEADVLRFQPRAPGGSPSSGDSLFGEAPPPVTSAAPRKTPGLLDTQINAPPPWTPDAPDIKPVDFFADNDSLPPHKPHGKDLGADLDALSSIEIESDSGADERPKYVTRHSWLWLYITGSIVLGIAIAAAIILPGMESSTSVTWTPPTPIPPPANVTPHPAPTYSAPPHPVSPPVVKAAPPPTIAAVAVHTEPQAPVLTPAQRAAVAATQPTVPPFVITALPAGSASAATISHSLTSIDAGPFYQPASAPPAPSSPPAAWPATPARQFEPIVAFGDVPQIPGPADMLSSDIASPPTCLVAMTRSAIPAAAGDAQKHVPQSAAFTRFDAQTLQPIGSPLRMLQDDAGQNIASPDGQYLICWPASESPALQIWSLPLQKQLSTIALPAGAAPQLLGFYNRGDFAFIESSSRGSTLELVDAATGAKLRGALMPPGSANLLAIDAAGAALAMVNQTASPHASSPNQTSQTLLIYDLQYGDWRRLPIGALGQSTFAPVALAFSPDGARLALLCDDGISAVVHVWKTRSGENARPLVYPTLGLSPASSLSAASALAPRTIDFLADNRTLALRGIALVDTVTGRMVGRTGIENAAEQVVLPAQRLLVRTADPAPLWRVASLAGDAVQRREAAVRSATTMPTLPIVSPLPDWTVRVRPDPPPPAAPFVASTQPLPTLSGPLADAVPLGAPQRVGPIFFTTEPLGEALAVHPPERSAGWRADDPSHQWIDRLDLHTGQTLDAFDIPPGCTVLDVSPDGAVALLGAAGDFDGGPMQRLFVWSLNNAKLLAAWRPFAAAPPNQQTIVWARIIDASHVMSLSNAGSLILWSTRDHLSEWRYASVQPLPALSPTRKWMIIRTTGPLRLFEVATGKLLGDLESVSDPSAPIFDLTYSGDGTSCAGAWHGGATVWDFHTGCITQTLTVLAQPAASPDANPSVPPAMPPSIFGFAPAPYLMANDLLVDRNRNAVAFDYPIDRGRHIVGPNSGRQWFIACSSPAHAWLCNAALPSPADAKALALIANHPPLVMPGAGLGLKVDLDSDEKFLTLADLLPVAKNALIAEGFAVQFTPGFSGVPGETAAPTGNTPNSNAPNINPPTGATGVPTSANGAASGVKAAIPGASVNPNASASAGGINGPVAIAVLHFVRIRTHDRVAVQIAGVAPPPQGWPVVPIDALQCHATLQTPDGTLLWDSGVTTITGGAANVDAPVENLQSADPRQLIDLYNRAMTASATRWAQTIPWPRYLAADGTILPAPQRTLVAPAGQ